MFSWFIHTKTVCLCYVPFYCWILCNCMDRYHILFIHLFIGGQLDCFHILGIMNSVVINISVQVSVWLCFLNFCWLGTYLGAELLSHRITLLHCLRTCQTIFQSSCTLYMPTSHVWEHQGIIQNYVSLPFLHSTLPIPGNPILSEWRIGPQCTHSPCSLHCQSSLYRPGIWVPQSRTELLQANPIASLVLSN